MEKELTLQEVEAAIVDRLVTELDPRNQVATKAFFELVRPEVTEKIATFYNGFHRMQIETALRLRRVANDIPVENFRDKAKELLNEIYASAFDGYDEVRPMLVALRADADDGITCDLDLRSLDIAAALLNEEDYELQVEKQIDPNYGK